MCNDGERVGVGKGCQVYYQLSIQIQCILSILSNNIPAKKGVRDSNLNECTHVQGKSLRVYIYLDHTGVKKWGGGGGGLQDCRWISSLFRFPLTNNLCLNIPLTLTRIG